MWGNHHSRSKFWFVRSPPMHVSFNLYDERDFAAFCRWSDGIILQIKARCDNKFGHPVSFPFEMVDAVFREIVFAYNASSFFTCNNFRDVFKLVRNICGITIVQHKIEQHLHKCFLFCMRLLPLFFLFSHTSFLVLFVFFLSV